MPENAKEITGTRKTDLLDAGFWGTLTNRQLSGVGKVVHRMDYDDSWHLHARCRNNYSHLFFPPSKFERKDERERREIKARAVCNTCSVKKECLEYALEIREPFGIWGGFTEAERKEIMLVT